MDYSAPCRPSRLFTHLFRGLKLSVCSLLLLLVAQNAFAAPVTLAWNAVPGTTVDGYILYYGYTSGNYNMSVDVGNYTSAGLSGLEEGRTYYFAVTAYDVYDNESPYSNEVSYNIPVAGETPPTVAITSPTSGTSVPRRGTVTISATASDNVGVTRVEFYINGQRTCSDTTASYTCAWKVPASPGRTYQLQAKAYDAEGNVGTSSLITVTTQ
jgi:Bacterial Ig domain